MIYFTRLPALLLVFTLTGIPTTIATATNTSSSFNNSNNSTTLDELRYNQVRQKNSHNSYERREGLLDQMIYHHCRTIEIDAHLGFVQDLYSVYHDAGLFKSYSSFNRLQDGLNLLMDFHRMFPNHNVVTVFMDIKGGFTGGTHSPEGFDALIGQLPLWTPAHAQGNATSIKEGIDLNGWPKVEDLRGKFLWILTHGQDDYCDINEVCVTRKAFSSTSIQNATEIGLNNHIVFYNQKAKVGEVGPAIYQAGYVGRVYDSNDIADPEKWNLAVRRQFQHVATDKINYHVHPFSKTHNAFGYPFETLNGVDVSARTPKDEGGAVMYMYAKPGSGDAWGRQDEIHFAYSNYTTRTNEIGLDQNDWIEYTTSISVANSHCDKFAKAGIMMREEDPRFPLGSGQYFAVVRTCTELLRVQYRERAYMLTVSARVIPTEEDAGFEQSKRMSIKVRYRYDGKDSYAEGYYKLEGKPEDDPDSYRLIHSQVFPNAQLSAHGVFTSSHYWDGNDDGTPFKALFVNTKRNNVTVTADSFQRRHGYDDPEAFGDGYFPYPTGPGLSSTSSS